MLVNSTKIPIQILILLILSVRVYGQVGSDTLSVSSSLNDTTHFKMNSFGYVNIDKENFNEGLRLSVFDLLKDKMPGLGLYKRGSDPNGSYTYNMRGISSAEMVEPLIVVDGMIVTDSEVIDPNDIESIRIGKGIAALSEYGFIGSSGVIEITTNMGDFEEDYDNNERFEVQYQGYLALSNTSKTVPVMNRNEYLQAGGNDLGGDTNWQEQVSRRAVSQINHLAVSGGNNNTRYSVSGSVRNVEGVLDNSGFEQFNARGSIIHNTLNDRLKLRMNLASNKRDANYSFAEAFRYANVYNPTSPIRFENGNFVQPILFDNFNPLAIVEMNTNDGQSKNLSYNVQADYDITSKLRFSANFSQQFHSNSYGEFYPSTSFFRGLRRDGLARRSFNDGKFTFFEARGNYHRSLGDRITIGALGGYSFQEYFNEALTLELGNLPSNDLGYYGIDLSGDRVLGNPLNVFVDSYATPQERIVSYFGRANLSLDHRFFVQASLRREGSSKLGRNTRWALFPALSVALDMNSYWNSELFDELTVRLSYGKTGRLPNQSGLSRNRFEYDFFNGGTVRLNRLANPDLKWEDRKEINIGFDYGLLDNRLQGTFEFYRVNVNDFIQEVYDSGISNFQYQNVGEIVTTGVEVALNYNILGQRDIQWDTGLIFSSYKSILNDFRETEMLAGFPGAPGQGSVQLVRLAVGEELGQIWGPVFSGQVDEDGYPVMVDLNNDGQLQTNYGSALSEDGDFTELGNAIPDFELGWSHSVGYKNWSLQAFFKGAFGHSLINLNRMFYEPLDPGAIGTYNRVVTDKAVEGLTVSRFSSLYVESADYLKLDYLTTSYRIPVKRSQAINSLTAYMTIENVFTITGYTGLSPEPVLEDIGPVDNGARIGNEPDPLIMGIDRRLNYLPARNFIFGVKVIF